MSKRAEELAMKLYRIAEDTDGNDSRMADLIDAELRKERERCAEKLTLWPVGKGHSQEYRNGYMSALNRCAAILSEEE